MKTETLTQKIDQGLRFFLYLLVFWLPYSKAAIELCVGGGLLLWLARCAVVWKSNGFKAAFRLPDSPLNRWIGLFLLVCGLSALGSSFWEQSMRGLFSKTLEWFLIYFLAVAALKKPKHVMVLFFVFLLTTSATALDGLIQFFWLKKDLFFGRALVQGYRVTAGMAHANSLAAYLTVSIPVTMSALFAQDLRRWLKGGLLVSLIAQFVVLALTYTRGAYLAAVFSAGLMLFKGRGSMRFIKRKRNVALILVLGIVLLGMMLGPRWDPARHLATTLQWRGAIWRDCLTMIERRPFLGHGPNTFMMLFPEYRHATAVLDPPIMTYAHNCFLQLTAETGLLGLAAFMGIIWILIKSWASLSRPQNSLSWLGVGTGAGLLGFLVHSAVDTHFYSLQLSSAFWLFAGVLISLSRMLSENTKCDINRH